MKDKIIRYYEESVVEMKKVTYPSKQEITGSTIVVVIFSIIISIFIYFVDFALSETVTFVLKQ